MWGFVALEKASLAYVNAVQLSSLRKHTCTLNSSYHSQLLPQLWHLSCSELIRHSRLLFLPRRIYYYVQPLSRWVEATARVG